MEDGALCSALLSLQHCSFAAVSVHDQHNQSHRQTPKIKPVSKSDAFSQVLASLQNALKIKKNLSGRNEKTLHVIHALFESDTCFSPGCGSWNGVF